MAVYATYKKVRADQIPSGEITSDDIVLGANVEVGVILSCLKVADLASASLYCKC